MLADDCGVSGPEELRGISNRLLAHIADLHELERQSRTVGVGSPEFACLSARVTKLSQDVHRLAEEQEAIGLRLAPEPTTIEDLDRSEADQSPSV